MATATFRFHGELAEFLPRSRRGVTFEQACAQAATIKHAVEALGVPHTEVGRLTVNTLPATLARIVRERDAIEVFPHAGAQALGTPRFLADAHLGGLARLLRMLGLDTRYENGCADRALIDLAVREERVVLTRDRELLKCRDMLRGCFVHAVKPEAQLQEVTRRYALTHAMRPFTLCLHCNVALQPAAKAEVEARVPGRVAALYTRYARCPVCERIYWAGSHWQHMRTMLSAALGARLPEGLA